MALGAECCWIGRPVIWGLAVRFPTLFFQNSATSDVEFPSTTVKKEYKRLLTSFTMNSDAV
jgi:hypothetical protein